MLPVDCEQGRRLGQLGLRAIRVGLGQAQLAEQHQRHGQRPLVVVPARHLQALLKHGPAPRQVAQVEQGGAQPAEMPGGGVLVAAVAPLRQALLEDAHRAAVVAGEDGDGAQHEQGLGVLAALAEFGEQAQRLGRSASGPRVRARVAGPPAEEEQRLGQDEPVLRRARGGQALLGESPARAASPVNIAA